MPILESILLAKRATSAGLWTYRVARARENYLQLSSWEKSRVKALYWKGFDMDKDEMSEWNRLGDKVCEGTGVVVRFLWRGHPWKGPQF
jgi:hypothetical protein